MQLLAGMVRDNRPWRLVPQLSRALAAAAGALGSSLETSRQVQHATFSKREQERRAKAKAERRAGS